MMFWIFKQSLKRTSENCFFLQFDEFYHHSNTSFTLVLTVHITSLHQVSYQLFETLQKPTSLQFFLHLQQSQKTLFPFFRFLGNLWSQLFRNFFFSYSKLYLFLLFFRLSDFVVVVLRTEPEVVTLMPGALYKFLPTDAFRVDHVLYLTVGVVSPILLVIAEIESIWFDKILQRLVNFIQNSHLLTIGIHRSDSDVFKKLVKFWCEVDWESQNFSEDRNRHGFYLRIFFRRTRFLKHSQDFSPDSWEIVNHETGLNVVDLLTWQNLIKSRIVSDFDCFFDRQSNFDFRRAQ